MKTDQILQGMSLLIFLAGMPGLVMAQAKGGTVPQVSVPAARPAPAPWTGKTQTAAQKTVHTRQRRSIPEIMGRRVEMLTKRAARFDKAATLHQKRGRTELADHYKRLAGLTRAIGGGYQAPKGALERQPLPKKTAPPPKTK